MKSFEYTIKLDKGLVVRSKTSRNSAELEVLKGMSPGPLGGLVFSCQEIPFLGYSAVEYPTSPYWPPAGPLDSTLFAPPWPQVFKMYDKARFIRADRYEVAVMTVAETWPDANSVGYVQDPGNETVDLSLIYAYNQDIPYGPWHGMQVGKANILMNGGVTLVVRLLNGAVKMSYATLSGIGPDSEGDPINRVAYKMLHLGSAINFNGQIVGCGADLTHTHATFADSAAYYNTNGITPNHAVWGKIGSVDFTLDESNVAGNRPLPGCGKILRVLKLGKRIVFYGTDGIAITEFSGVNLSVIRMIGIGIPNRGAADGDDNSHVFIGSGGGIYHLTGELQLSDQMYKETINNSSENREVLRGSIVVHDKIHARFYISLPWTTYVFTSQGLGNSNYVITGICESGLEALPGTFIVAYALGNSTLVGYPFVNDPDHVRPDLYAYLETGTFDLGTMANKTITGIEVGYAASKFTDPSYPESISLKPNISGMIWSTLEPTDKGNFIAPLVKSNLIFNKSGYAATRIYCKQFYITLSASDAHAMQIDYILVKYQLDDKRTQREIDVDKIIR